MTTDTQTPCTCPSGDGSLRWPCPAHPIGLAASEAQPYYLSGPMADGAWAVCETATGRVVCCDVVAAEALDFAEERDRLAGENAALLLLIQRVAKYPASVDCAGTLLRHDVLRAAGPPETWKA